MKFINSLKGRKTYFVALVIAVLNLLVAYEVISVQQLEQINMVLVALGIGALRSGINTTK